MTERTPKSSSFWNYRPTTEEVLTIVGLLFALVVVVGGALLYAHIVGMAHSHPPSIVK
jgi:hypothetical protein